ncbi:hypothetical protein RclHR1_08200001 [Rhizophagus clarus]|uniref:P-loop containing nucleoside triphosphate hydrolase protein n=1 Tax=Rhizophagus clarus TaxID=94130 RepID=A0A2Z6SN23_9GLOM|nr:hypothetical protein RclHR1_08200001 [Rhizophagus clarus]GES99358.1 P-loop containing nucleoside triphosphate hydrolase protein [Rhizophagus clarus]
MATTNTEIPDVKELKEISNDEIIKELKKKGSSAKILNVIHVIKLKKKERSEKTLNVTNDAKPSSEKDAGSSESSSDKKHSIVISEEGALCFKSYVVWLITYESTSEEIINITTKKYFEDKKIYSKEVALAKAIDIKFELKNNVDSEKPSVTKPDETTDPPKDDNDTSDYKNILLVGRTGDGKSAIANVLVDSVDKDGMPYFEESACGVSKTKEPTIVPFEHEGKKYRIIDTIGIGDTNLSFGEVLERIIKAIHSVNYRLNHIFFVTRGRMTREEIDTFNLLKSVIFCDKDKDKGQFLFEKYTTLVRSGFGEFEDLNERQRDTQLMMRESNEINNLITSCKGGFIIYVDNPPVYIELDQELAEAKEKNDDKKVKELEEKLKGLKKEKEVSVEKRKRSRKILLESLEKSEKEKEKNHQNDYYEAKNIRELGEKIIPLMNQVKMLKEILNILEEKEKNNNDGNDKATRKEELKKAYKKKEENLKKLVLKEIKTYADERDKVTVIKTDEDDENTKDQFTKTVGTTLISIGGIVVNAFVPGLGSEISQVLIGLIKPKNDQETSAQ